MSGHQSNRRTTLAVLSESSFNSRASLGFTAGGARRSSIAPAVKYSLTGNSVVASAAPRLSTSRQSLDPMLATCGNSQYSSAGARLSFVPQSMTINQRSDPKVIRDKAYQLKCMRNLMRFLTENGFSYPISTKVLTAPSGKEFERIFKFLLSRIDPNYTFSKFEDEVPAIIKFMNYPYCGDITKTQLHAVGTMHTWPTLLATLNWIVELIECTELLDSRGNHASDSALEGEKFFFEYLRKGYAAFLAGDDRLDNLQDGLYQSLTTKNEELQRSIATLENHIDGLKEEYEILTREEAPLLRLQRQKNDLVNDIDKFKKLILQLETRKLKIQGVISGQDEEIVKIDAELKSIHEEIVSIKQRLAEQRITLEDLEKLVSRREQVINGLNEIQILREQKNSSCWQQELQLAKSLEIVERALDEFHAQSTQIETILAVAERDFHANIPVTVDSSIVWPSLDLQMHGYAPQMMLINLKSNVRPALYRVCEQVAERIRITSEYYHSVRERINELSEQEEDRNAEVISTKNRLSKLESQYASEREKYLAESKQLEEEILEVEELLNQMKADGTNTLLRTQQMLQRTRIEQETLIVLCNEDRERVAGHMLQLLEELISLKAHLDNSLSEVHQIAVFP
jgi:kinetochore protein NDC80